MGKKNKGQHGKAVSVFLVDPQNRNYLSHLKKMSLEHRVVKGQYEVEAMNVLGGKVEKVIHKFFSERFNVANERILVQHFKNGYIKYQELDVVCGSKDSPEFFVEIKLSSNDKVIGTGQRQAFSAFRNAAIKWKNIRVIVVIINTLSEKSVYSVGQLSLEDIKLKIDNPVEYKTAEDIPFIQLSIDDVVDYARGTEFEVDEELLAKCKAESEKNYGHFLERKDLVERKIDPSKWPDYLHKKPVKKEIIEYHDSEAKENPFSDALAAIRSKL